MNTAVFVLRSLQVGLTLDDLNLFDSGEVQDLIIEMNNDSFDYPKAAQQSDIDMLYGD